MHSNQTQVALIDRNSDTGGVPVTTLPPTPHPFIQLFNSTANAWDPNINEREIKDMAAIRLLLFQLTDVAAVILIAVPYRFEV